MTASPHALEGIRVLGRYRIVQPLARGGMGMVYLGRVEGAAGFAKPVVIKRILSEEADESSHASFIREARILSELQHPCIVGVLDFGLERDTYLMVLEYVHGYHLGHWLKYVTMTRGALDWEFAVHVILRVLAALHHAHTHVSSDGQIKEIVHRDISPGNILIDVGGHVRLVDFGIARAKGYTSEFQTQDGVVKGKLSYIAPEVYRSQEASVASDVYAAGLVLYQLLSGRNPFSDRDMSKIVRKVLDHTPSPISALRNDVPAAIDDVLARAIQKDPAQRYRTAAEFASALSALLERSESEIAERFRATISDDFSGDLPQVLNIESLPARDAAWRASGTHPEREPSLLSSSRPPPPGEKQTVVVPVEPSSGVLRLEGTGTIQDAGRSTKRLLIALSLAFAATVGALVVLLLLGQRGPSNPEARFLVVERPGTPSSGAEANVEAPPSDLDSPEAADSATESQGDGATVEPQSPNDAPAPTQRPAQPPSSKPGPQSDSQALTAAFAKRQGAVQACFSSHASSLEGSPQITIRFQLSPSGEVNSASLSPAALAGTPLGACLLQVARSTKFPAQGKAVAFSIPITARVVNK